MGANSNSNDNIKIISIVFCRTINLVANVSWSGSHFIDVGVVVGRCLFLIFNFFLFLVVVLGVVGVFLLVFCWVYFFIF